MVLGLRYRKFLGFKNISKKTSKRFDSDKKLVHNLVSSLIKQRNAASSAPGSVKILQCLCGKFVANAL